MFHFVVLHYSLGGGCRKLYHASSNNYSCVNLTFALYARIHVFFQLLLFYQLKMYPKKYFELIASLNVNNILKIVNGTVIKLGIKCYDDLAS